MPDESTGALAPTRWRRIEAALDHVLAAPRDEWPRRIAEACGDDSEMERQVESLLEGVDHLEPFDQPAAASLAASLRNDNVVDAPEHDALIGAELGPWCIVREIGRGGMARVYLAERKDGAFEQAVAIKVLRAELDAPADLARFRRERRLLSALDHPHVARLLDAGVAPGGRPYLVLEHVDGEHLLAYCDAHALDVTRRLQLFLGVTDGVEAAHRRLILHRDIKPSNVMVGRDGRVRLLDFGVSTLLEGGDAEATPTRGHWLTPEYASPEQLQGAPLTSASDVYQLGALLYELLTGTRAFGTVAGARAAGGSQSRRDDPVPPSRHRFALRGDLDAIVLKAMRMASDDRYATVRELAADIRRYLAHEPVLARAGNRWYRSRRWTARNATALALTTALLVAAVGSVVTLAASRRRIATALASETLERTKATEVTSFLLALFRADDPMLPASDTVSARTLLQREQENYVEARAGFDEWERRALARPATRDLDLAQRLYALAEQAESIDSLARAERLFSESLSVFEERLGPTHVTAAELQYMLADAEWRDGKATRAEPRYRRAISLLRAAAPAGELVQGEALLTFAERLSGAGRHAEAVVFAEGGFKILRAAPPDHRVEIATSYENFGRIVARAGNLARSAALLDSAELHYTQLFGPRYALVFRARFTRGDMLWRMGRSREAEVLLGAAYRDWISYRGTEHPISSLGLRVLTTHLEQDGRTADAARYRAMRAAPPRRGATASR